MNRMNGWLIIILSFFEQEAANPYGNIESFDAIYYAVLQVIIVTGANGVSGRISVEPALDQPHYDSGPL